MSREAGAGEAVRAAGPRSAAGGGGGESPGRRELLLLASPLLRRRPARGAVAAVPSSPREELPGKDAMEGSPRLPRRRGCPGEGRVLPCLPAGVGWCGAASPAAGRQNCGVIAFQE